MFLSSSMSGLDDEIQGEGRTDYCGNLWRFGGEQRGFVW
jgi:hypothetical protein